MKGGHPISRTNIRNNIWVTRCHLLFVQVRPSSIDVPFRPNRLFTDMGAEITFCLFGNRVWYPFTVRMFRRLFMTSDIRKIRFTREVGTTYFFRRTINRRLICTTISTVMGFFAITNGSCLSSARQPFFSNINARKKVKFTNRTTSFGNVSCTFMIISVCFVVVCEIYFLRLNGSEKRTLFFGLLMSNNSSFKNSNKSVISPFYSNVSVRRTAAYRGSDQVYLIRFPR